MAHEKKEPPGVGLQIDAPTPTPDKGHYDDRGMTGNLNFPQPLSVEEKKYLLAVQRGDQANVKRILQKAHRHHHIDINCMDPLGRRALTLAIDTENLEMVELLIVMGVDTKDALLQAINAEFIEAVELLLEHEEIIHSEGEPYSWQKIDINTAMFTPDITPLILAAHKNNFEILKILLDRGAAVPVPHDIRCGCEECIRFSTEDALRHSLARVNVYKALASPFLISLTSNDPLLTAFQLSWELRNLAFTEQECKADYLQLRRQCQQFAVDLLDNIRNSQELAIILNEDSTSPPYTEGDHMSLAKLEEAIKFKQKKFVAHPNIQQLLASIWYEGVPGFRRKSNFEKLFTIAGVALLFPIYCLIYMTVPNCRTARLMRKPFMKFLIHASSYLFFLLILILVSQRAEDNVIELFGTANMKKSLEERMQRQRGNPPTFLEMVVVLYVMGFIWEEVQEIFNIGMRKYLRNMWNFIDFTRNALYISVVCLRTIAYIQQCSEIRRDPTTAFIPRELWNDFDPQLIAEGLFAAANIFSALKLIHLFSINPHLGPLQISLGRMIIDIVKFFFIYTLVLFSFACGLNQLLWYFANLEWKKCYSLPDQRPDWIGNGDACMKWRRFGNLFESSQSLFWASFGMVGLDTFELEGIKSYTRFWGLLMFGSYSVINVIVLLNLLIAMMSNSYAIIEEHSDTEWKFARTKLWMSYFEDNATLPPPFNILPSVKWIIRIFRKSQKEIRKRKSMKRKVLDENLYTNIMRALVWRYISAQHRKYEEAPVTEDDINEVKTEISSMRYEMVEIFSRNGMDVSSVPKKEKPVRAKRTKIWERRLMKDFQVTPVTVDSSADNVPANLNDTDRIDEHNMERPPPENEDPKSKFRRIARQIANDSIAHKWNEVLRSVTKNSQIGRCSNQQSFSNQQKLLRAIEEAKRLILISPPLNSGRNSPVEFIDDTSETLLDLLNEINSELGKTSGAGKATSASEGSQNQNNNTNNNKKSLQIKQLLPVKKSSPKPEYVRPISPPPMFSTEASTSTSSTNKSNNNNNNNSNNGKNVIADDSKKSNSINNRNNLLEMNIDKEKVSSQNPPEIRIVQPSPENNKMILSPGKLISLKAPPSGKSGKKAPPPPPVRNDECRSSTSTALSVSTLGSVITNISSKNTKSPGKGLRKSDSVPETFEPQITFLSLNDSTEQLVPRPSSPGSDSSSMPPSSPRLSERLPDITAVKRRAGWL